MMQLGMQLPHFVWSLAVAAENAFSVRWKDEAGAGLDLSSTTVRLIVDPGPSQVVFTASTATGGYSNWTLTAGQASAGLVGKPARLEFVVGPSTYLMASGRVAAA